MALTLQQIRAGVRDPMTGAAIDVLRTTDELLNVLPWRGLGDRSVYPYKRRVANPAVTWSARDAALSDTNAFKEVEIIGRTARATARQSIDLSNAGDAGGVPAVMGKKTAGALQAMAQAIGNKLITGDRGLTGAIPAGSSLAVTNGFSITAVGPNILSDRGTGSLKYTHSGTLVQFRAPGELEYGTAVAISTSTVAKVYGYNNDSWVEVTHGTQAMSANDTAEITFTVTNSEPEGILSLIQGVTSQIIYGGTNGGNISFAMIDQLMDLVLAPKDQKVLLMHKRTARAFKALARAAGGVTMAEINGRQMLTYDGTPIIVSDYVPATRTRGTASGTCTAAFCFTLGEGQGLHGVYSEVGGVDIVNARRILSAAPGVEIFDLGISSTRVDMSHLAVAHVGLVNEDTKGLAMLDGLLDTSA
jgi:hypothetical protein